MILLRRLCFVLFGTLAMLPLPAATPTPAQPRGPVAELTLTQAVVLGVVEGVTEFLPISSTGHLIIANQALGLESPRQLTDSAGRPLWHKPPSPRHPAGVPLTLKLAADTYTVLIQLGAIAAVLLLYWPRWWSMLLGLCGRDPAGSRLLRNLVLAVAPVVALGLLTHGWIEQHLFSLPAVIAALILGALLMLWTEHWRRHQPAATSSGSDPAALAPRQAFGIGLAQCLALWPGTSRSMVTIVGGYLAGLTPLHAAEFSFLVGLPTLAGAALFKAAVSGPAMVSVFGWSNLLVGMLVAALAAAAAVRFLVGFLVRHGLALFAYYRLALALVLAVLYLT